MSLKMYTISFGLILIRHHNRGRVQTTQQKYWYRLFTFGSQPWFPGQELIKPTTDKKQCHYQTKFNHYIFFKNSRNWQNENVQDMESKATLINKTGRQTEHRFYTELYINMYLYNYLFLYSYQYNRIIIKLTTIITILLM